MITSNTNLRIETNAEAYYALPQKYSWITEEAYVQKFEMNKDE